MPRCKTVFKFSSATLLLSIIATVYLLTLWIFQYRTSRLNITTDLGSSTLLLEAATNYEERLFPEKDRDMSFGSNVLPLSPSPGTGNISWPLLSHACKQQNESENGHGLFLLAIVHSAPKNQDRRMEMRKTWGNRFQFPELREMLLLFVLGSSGDSEVDSEVQRESNLFNDILGGNFLDSYQQLTYKALTWLAWTSNYCNGVRFILKTDDDVIVNIFQLLRHLKYLDRSKAILNKTFACMVWNDMPIQRDSSSKWYVPHEVYNGTTFPTYCSGMAYILTGDLVPLLCQQSRRQKFLWIDDVFVTDITYSFIGLLPLGIPGVRYYELNSLYVLAPTAVESRIVESRAVFGHVPSSSTLREHLWKVILKTKSQRSITN